MEAVELGVDELGVDPWVELTRYRERYDIEDRLEVVSSLERSIQRRHVRLAAAQQRVADLEKLLAEARRDLDVVDTEVRKSRQVGAQLISEILDQVRTENGEAWSPTPVLGFRMWHVADDALEGATQHRWASPSMRATCGRRIPGQDVPHSEERCGPPACGIYATKEVGWFPTVSGRRIDPDQAIGLVAMTGKVIEHDRGYRAAHVTVVALVARHRDRWILTDDAEIIASLFADPAATFACWGQESPHKDIEEFLNGARERRQPWT